MQKGFYRQTFPARVGCSHWCSALLTAVHLLALIIPVITRCFLESAFFFFLHPNNAVEIICKSPCASTCGCQLGHEA